MDKSRVCLVIPSLQPGGMERVMSELLHELAMNQKFELHLLLYGITREVFYTIPAAVHVHMPPFHFNNRYRAYYTLRTMRYLRKEIRAIAPATVLSFGEIWNNLVLLSLLGISIPVFVSDRSSPAKNLSAIQEHLRAALYKRANGIIVQTESARDIYRRKFAKKSIAVIANPIRQIQSTQNVQRENIVLTVGRLIESKHHYELIKLFLKINHLGWRLVIVGDDAQKQKVRRKLELLIRQMRAEDKVILTGTRRDVDDFYLRSKVFAFMSSSEGFPNVLGEAMAAGMPAIAFDCVAGPSDLITDGENGFLVSLFDYESYEAKLRLLMTDEDLRLRIGTEARASVKRFSVDRVAGQFQSFILHNENTSN